MILAMAGTSIAWSSTTQTRQTTPKKAKVARAHSKASEGLATPRKATKPSATAMSSSSYSQLARRQSQTQRKGQRPLYAQASLAAPTSSSSSTTTGSTSELSNQMSVSGTQVARPQVVKKKRKAEALSQAALLNPSSSDQWITGNVAFAHSQNLVDRKDGSMQASELVLAMINTQLNPNWGVTTRLAYSRDLKNSESLQDGFSDLSFLIRKRPNPLASWLIGGPIFSVVVPVSELSTRFQDSQGSLGASYLMMFTPGTLATGFDLGVVAGVSRNFHRFEEDESGNVLNEYGMRETIFGSYSFGNFNLSADLTFHHARNYRGRITQAYEHSQEIGYAITSHWALTVGHSNGGSWFRPNGQDSNFRLINENDSTFYATTSLRF